MVEKKNDDVMHPDFNLSLTEHIGYNKVGNYCQSGEKERHAIYNWSDGFWMWLLISISWELLDLSMFLLVDSTKGS